jgi:hypothetical protein
VKLEDI